VSLVPTRFTEAEPFVVTDFVSAWIEPPVITTLALPLAAMPTGARKSTLINVMEQLPAARTAGPSVTTTVVSLTMMAWLPTHSMGAVLGRSATGGGGFTGAGGAGAGGGGADGEATSR
jgi:uncharacterized membrane protein YgcG